MLGQIQGRALGYNSRVFDLRFSIAKFSITTFSITPGQVTSMAHKFKTKLLGEAGSEVAALKPPFYVPATLGRKGRIPVKGTINGFPFRSRKRPSCMPISHVPANIAA